MTVREKAPTVLTREGARRLTGKIRDSLVLSDALVLKAYEGRIWEVSQPRYPDFESWCDGELPELQTLQLRAPARKARALALRAKGATIPEIVKATRSSLGSIHRDLTPKAVPSPSAPGGGTGQHTVTGHETPGASPLSFQVETAPAVDQPVSREHKTNRVVALIAAAGPAGLDVKQVQRALGCERNEASATLTRLHAAGRVGYVAPVRRGLFGRYVAPR